MRLNNIYKHSVAFNRPIKFEIHSFIGCLKSYYDFPTNIVRRIEHIFIQVDANYRPYFGKIPYENVIMGITVFAVKEFKQRINDPYDSPPFDISDYVINIWGINRYKSNITQVYYVFLIIQALFDTQNNQTITPLAVIH